MTSSTAHDRRNFLSLAGKGLGLAALSSVTVASLLKEIQAATKSVAHLTPQQAAMDEDYWSVIQNAFSVTRGIINLNNGGVSPSPRIVTEALVRYIWQQEDATAYTMWQILEPQSETIRTGLAEVFGCDRPQPSEFVSPASQFEYDSARTLGRAQLTGSLGLLLSSGRSKSQIPGLFDGTRTDDEDIYESFCALLPVRAGRHMGHADKSPKQIHGIKVLPHVAALDRALHQRTKRFVDLIVGSCEHFFGISDQSAQHRGDDLLRLNGIHEQQ